MLIACNDLYKIYSKKNNSSLAALKGCDFFVDDGEFVTIIGPSGAGKSTLLNLIGLIDKPTSGEIIFDNKRVDGISSYERTSLRRKYISLIHQFPYRNLNMELTAIRNLNFAQKIYNWKIPRQEILKNSSKLLKEWNLSYLSNKIVNKLSMGEIMRLSILTAISKSPLVILADEPTGTLDTHNSLTIRDFLHKITRENHITTVTVTHDPIFEESVDKRFFLEDGKLSSVQKKDSLKNSSKNEFYCYIDSSNNIRLPNKVKNYLKLSKQAKLTVTDNKVELSNPFIKNSAKEILNTKNLSKEDSNSIEIDKMHLNKIEETLKQLYEYSKINKKTEIINPIINCNGVNKSFLTGNASQVVLNNINFQINKGEVCIIQGPSGIGKTTFLKILSCILSCDNGSVTICNKNISSFSRNEIMEFRKINIGYLSHALNVHPNMNVYENINFSFKKNSDKINNFQFILDLIDTVFMGNYIKSSPNELSGGELRRIEFISTIAQTPKILLLDEPSANLDLKLTNLIKHILIYLSQVLRVTIIVATHDIRLIDKRFRVINLTDINN